MSKKIRQHKNNFFLGTFSHKEAGMSLREYLPPDVSESMQWDTLQQEAGSFVDAALKNKETDILYSIRRNDGSDGFVYVLLEHQSKEDKWMPFRLLAYMVRIWENYRKQHPDAKKLPVIVPIVLYQGKTAWKQSMDFTRLFQLNENAALRPYLPHFRSEMISLPTLKEEDIKGDLYVQVAFRLMKAIRNGNVIACISDIESLLEQITDQRDNIEFALTCFTYALQADDIDKPQLQDTFKNIQNPKLHATAMTVAEQLIDEGIQKGRQQDIIEVLTIRFSDVPKGMQEAVRQISSDSRLRALHRTSVTCSSLESFAKHL